MDLKSILASVATPETVQNIADNTGESPSTVKQIVKSGLPLVLGQLGQNTTTESGASSLNSALDQHQGGVLEALGGLFGDSKGANNDGLSILGNIFGNSSDDAASHVTKKTGVDTATVMKVLSFIAPLVLAYLAQKRTNGGIKDTVQSTKDDNGDPLIDIVGSILGGGDKSNNGGIIGSILGGLLGKK